MTATGMATGGTGPSTVDFWYPLPARLASPPSALGTPTVSRLGPTSTNMSWTAPASNNGASVSGYEYQLDSSGSGFPSPEVWVATGSTSATISGLVPATTCYARVKAQNAAGWSARSGTRTFTTLSGGKVRVAGAWVDKAAKARVGGAWVTAKTNKRAGGVWKP